MMRLYLCVPQSAWLVFSLCAVAAGCDDRRAEPAEDLIAVDLTNAPVDTMPSDTSSDDLDASVEDRPDPDGSTSDATDVDVVPCSPEQIDEDMWLEGDGEFTLVARTQWQHGCVAVNTRVRFSPVDGWAPAFRAFFRTSICNTCDEPTWLRWRANVALASDPPSNFLHDLGTGLTLVTGDGERISLCNTTAGGGFDDTVDREVELEVGADLELVESEFGVSIWALVPLKDEVRDYDFGSIDRVVLRQPIVSLDPSSASQQQGRIACTEVLPCPLGDFYCPIEPWSFDDLNEVEIDAPMPAELLEFYRTREGSEPPP